MEEHKVDPKFLFLTRKYCVISAWNALTNSLPRSWRKGFLYADCWLCDKRSDVTSGKISFSISPRKNIFYCFVCQNGGDAYSLISQSLNCGYHDAEKWLAENKVARLYEHNDGGMRCENAECIVQLDHQLIKPDFDED